MTAEEIANSLAWSLYYACEDPVQVNESEYVVQHTFDRPLAASTFLLMNSHPNGLGETPELFEVTISVKKVT